MLVEPRIGYGSVHALVRFGPQSYTQCFGLFSVSQKLFGGANNLSQPTIYFFDLKHSVTLYGWKCRSMKIQIFIGVD